MPIIFKLTLISDEHIIGIADQYLCAMNEGGGGDMKAACKQILILALCILMSIAMVLAVPKNNGNGKGKAEQMHGGRQSVGVGASVGVSIFVAGDRNLIRNHYSSNQGNLPPGLAKRGGDLPPGLQKQLIRNGHLPPGLEKKLYPFPPELERRLPPLREGLSRGIIGVHAVIYDNKTRLIIDIFAIL